MWVSDLACLFSGPTQNGTAGYLGPPPPTPPRAAAPSHDGRSRRRTHLRPEPPPLPSPPRDVGPPRAAAPISIVAAASYGQIPLPAADDSARRPRPSSSSCAQGNLASRRQPGIWSPADDLATGPPRPPLTSCAVASLRSVLNLRRSVRPRLTRTARCPFRPATSRRSAWALTVA